VFIGVGFQCEYRVSFSLEYFPDNFLKVDTPLEKRKVIVPFSAIVMEVDLSQVGGK
jgi:hypothetical protein